MPSEGGSNEGQRNDQQGSKGQDSTKKTGKFNKRNNSTKSNRGQNSKPRIKEHIEELEQNVYIIGSLFQADFYTNTTKAIANYVGKEYGRDMRTLVSHLTENTFTKPMQSTPESGQATASQMEVEEWKTKLNRYYKQQDTYKENKAKVFIVIKGQCTAAVINKVEAMSNYENIEQDYNVIKLLAIIKIQHLKQELSNITTNQCTKP